MKDKMKNYKLGSGYQSHVFVKLAIPTPMYKKIEKVAKYMDKSVEDWAVNRLSGQLSRFHSLK